MKDKKTKENPKAKLEVPQAHLNRPQAMIVNDRSWLMAVLGFIILCILSWLDEVFDLPHLLMGAIQTPFNPVEASMESVLIIIVGFFTILIIKRNIAENKKKENLLKDYHANLELRIKERTAELVKVNQELSIYIEEHRKIEQTLRQTRDYLEKLFNYTNASIVVWDTEFKITRFNRAFERLTGYSAEKVIGRELQMLFPEASRDDSLAKIALTSSGEYWESVEIPILRKDGDIRITLWNLANIYAEDGTTLLATIGQGQDITERKKAEEALKKSEEFKNRMIESSNDCIKVLDLEGRLMYMSLSGQRLLDIEDITSYLNKSWLDFWKGSDNKVVCEAVSKAVSGGFGNFEGFCPTTKGIPKWWDVKITPIKNADGKIEQLLAISRDITERKKAEEILRRDKESFERLVNQRSEQLIKTQKDLAEAKRLSDIGALAATVAHELRNPLGVIRTAAYNIRRKRQNPLLDNHLNNIEKKVLESDQIINNLLDYSRIKMPQYEKIKIDNIIDECIAAAKKRFSNQMVSIYKSLKPEKGNFIEADPFQISEIFCNILNNAYQSILNKKGKIVIKVDYDKDDFVKISFKDNGVGIDKEDLNKIFEPFFTRKSKGTGLGLTICKELVNLHGGRIDIGSETGKGTTVTISLPVRREIK